MDFEELHGKSGSGTNVGVDLTTLMTSQVAAYTAGESDGGGSGSGDMTVPRIASFQIYWDVGGKKFKVFSPKVVDPSGNEVAVTETALSRGTYVCEVKKNATTGIYTAAIKLTDGVVPSADTVTVVKLFKIEDGKVEQFHVGAIILGSKGESKPAAFDLVVSESSSGTNTGKIVRCNFVFDGENKSLPDFSVSGSGSVYLVAKQTAPSSGDGDPPWTFEISESEGEATSGGRVVNYKLYDLNDFSVTCDYRTTFLELKSPHERAEIIVKKPGADVSTDPHISMNASRSSYVDHGVVYDSNGKKFVNSRVSSSQTTTTASAGTGKTVTTTVDDSKSSIEGANGSKSFKLDTSDISKGTDVKFHTLTVKDADGGETKYTVLADKDIELFAAKGTVLKDVELQYSNYSLQMKKTTIDLETGVETEGSFETVFTTEPHSEQS